MKIQLFIQIVVISRLLSIVSVRSVHSTPCGKMMCILLVTFTVIKNNKIALFFIHITSVVYCLYIKIYGTHSHVIGF